MKQLKAYNQGMGTELKQLAFLFGWIVTVAFGAATAIVLLPGHGLMFMGGAFAAMAWGGWKIFRWDLKPAMQSLNAAPSIAVQNVARFGLDALWKQTEPEFYNFGTEYLRGLGLIVTPDSGLHGPSYCQALETGLSPRFYLVRFSYATQTGEDVVRELAGRVKLGTSGLLICQAYLTDEAKRVAKAAEITVIDGEQLVERLTAIA
jgi:hypothetical protein